MRLLIHLKFLPFHPPLLMHLLARPPPPPHTHTHTHTHSQVELIPTIRSYIQAASTLISKQDYSHAVDYLEPSIEVCVRICTCTRILSVPIN